jgi:hypothetical protein
VPDLVAEVSQQRAVRLVHLDSQLLAVHVVAFREIYCDDPVFVSGQDLLVCAGQQPESQPVVRILIVADNRQFELVQLDDQPTLGCFGSGEVREAAGVSIVGPFDSQRARHAEQARLINRDQPVAFGDMAIGAQFVFAGAHEASFVGVVASGDHQQGHLVEGETQGAPAGQARRVLERQALAAVGTVEITHPARHLRTARRPPPRRSRCFWSWCR